MPLKHTGVEHNLVPASSLMPFKHTGFDWQAITDVDRQAITLDEENINIGLVIKPWPHLR